MSKPNHQHNRFRMSRILLLYHSSNACYICSDKSISNHCHHIDKNSKNNDAFNLVILCEKCHKLNHKLNSMFVMLLSTKEKRIRTLINIYFNSI